MALLGLNDTQLDLADTPAARKPLVIHRVRLLDDMLAYEDTLRAQGFGRNVVVTTLQLQLARTRLELAETPADRANEFADLVRAATALAAWEREGRPGGGGSH